MLGKEWRRLNPEITDPRSMYDAFIASITPAAGQLILSPPLSVFVFFFLLFSRFFFCYRSNRIQLSVRFLIQLNAISVCVSSCMKLDRWN